MIAFKYTQLCMTFSLTHVDVYKYSIKQEKFHLHTKACTQCDQDKSDESELGFGRWQSISYTSCCKCDNVLTKTVSEINYFIILLYGMWSGAVHESIGFRLIWCWIPFIL